MNNSKTINEVFKIRSFKTIMSAYSTNTADIKFMNTYFIVVDKIGNNERFTLKINEHLYLRLAEGDIVNITYDEDSLKVKEVHVRS